MEFQFSSVKTQNTTRKEFCRSSKFCRLGVFDNYPPKNAIPKSVNMNMNMTNNSRIYINAQNALLSTLIRKPINWRDRINLVTLSTLKALKILTDLNADNEDFPLPPLKKNNSTKLSITMVASNLFIVSLRYSIGPIPSTLTPNSIVNMIVNAKLN